MQTIHLTLPAYFQAGRKQVLLGMNWYRNCNFHISNKVKQEYKSQVLAMLPTQLPFNQYQITYIYHFKSIVSDLPNITGICSKFLNDALKEANIIKDDNVQYLKQELHLVGTQDKLNPRIEVIIGQFHAPDNPTINP